MQATDYPMIMSGKELINAGIEKIIYDIVNFNTLRFVKSMKPGLMVRLDSTAFSSLLWLLAKINESGEFVWSPESQTLKAGLLDPTHAYFFKFTWDIEKSDYQGMVYREIKYAVPFSEMAAILKTAGAKPRERLFHPADMPQYTIIFDPHDQQITVKDNFEIINSDKDTYILHFKEPSIVDEPFSDSPGIAENDYLKLQIDVKKFLTILEMFKKDGQTFLTLLPGKESAEFRGAPFTFNFDGEGKLGKASVMEGSISLEPGTQVGENGYNWEQAYKTYAKYFVLEKKVLEGTASLSEVAEFTRLEDLRNKFSYAIENLHIACSFFSKSDIERVDAEVTKEGVLFMRFVMLGGRIHGLFIIASYSTGASEQYVFISEENHTYQAYDPDIVSKPQYSNYFYLKDKWVESLITRLSEHYGFKNISEMVHSIKLSDKKIASEEEKENNNGLIASFAINLKIPEDIQTEFKLKEITGEEVESGKESPKHRSVKLLINEDDQKSRELDFASYELAAKELIKLLKEEAGITIAIKENKNTGQFQVQKKGEGGINEMVFENDWKGIAEHLAEEMTAELDGHMVYSIKAVKSKPLAAISLNSFLANIIEPNEYERSRLWKGYRSLQKRYKEHELKKEQINMAGGHDTSVIKEMRAFLIQKVKNLHDLDEDVPAEIDRLIQEIESLRKP